MFEETAKLLEILQMGYIICLVLAIVFFLISVLLFFVFDIRNIFLIRTGRAAKRDIRKLAEKNFQTGQLRRPDAGKYDMSNSGSLDESQETDVTEPMGKETDAVQQSQFISQGEQETGAEGTTVLGQNETTVLNGEFTTVLNAGATTVLNQEEAERIGRKRVFILIKNEMYIHTEEII